jgi:hypothetical protein
LINEDSDLLSLKNEIVRLRLVMRNIRMKYVDLPVDSKERNLLWNQEKVVLIHVHRLEAREQTLMQIAVINQYLQKKRENDVEKM